MRAAIEQANIAFWTSDLGDRRKGLRLSTDLLVDETRVFGPGRPDTSTTRVDRGASGEMPCSEAGGGPADRPLRDPARSPLGFLKLTRRVPADHALRDGPRAGPAVALTFRLGASLRWLSGRPWR
jgi:hypothetical protein